MSRGRCREEREEGEERITVQEAGERGHVEIRVIGNGLVAFVAVGMSWDTQTSAWNVVS